MTIPIALTIAGSDSSGGAGIQADLKSFAACGVYGASVITALTAQNTRGVTATHAVPPDFVAAQLDAVFDDLDIRAVKIGMTAEAAVIEAIAAALRRYKPAHVVLDPVMIATSGARLIAPDAVDTLRMQLLPLAHLVTPNLPEAAALLDTHVATTIEQVEAQGRALLERGAKAVLIKGGHGTGADSIDVLVARGRVRSFVGPRFVTANTHGTGCSLSSAIGAYLAKGESLESAVTLAKRYVAGAIAAADALEVGKGAGPIHHFHALWR